ncbi:MAG: hypothetical protein ACRDT2_01810 [Natronosporangium sp.]
MPDVVIDWGARSEALRTRHAKLGAVRSFLLAAAPNPVALGTMAVTDTGVAWDLAPMAGLAVTPVAGQSRATATVPDGTRFLRLDFRLSATIGGASATVLEFRQLFEIGSGGALLPQRYSMEDVDWRAGSGTGSPAPVRVLGGRRSFLGTCPLLRVTAGRLEVNCEFVDVTALWWAHWAAGDTWGWYLDPTLAGAVHRLRVLAWTSGTLPMVWFAAVSAPAASTAAGGDRPGADLVFYRPITGMNSFGYKPTAAGFLDSRHGDTTMFNLARWLLQPLRADRLAAKFAATSGAAATGGAAKPAAVWYTGIRLLPSKRPPDIRPKDPLDLVQLDVRWAFRLAGIEGALARTPSPDVVYLPLGTPGEVYGGAVARELTATLASAWAVLWLSGAVGRDLTATPAGSRQIWLGGHSAENRAMFQSLQANAAAVDRIISCDATPTKKLLFPEGVPTVTAAAKARSALGKKLAAFFVTTPNMWLTEATYQDIKKQLDGTKAAVTMLPLEAERVRYWQHPPTKSTNPHLFEVLAEWDGNGLASSQRFGTLKAPPPAENRQWLLWHEWAVHGGHLVLDGATPPAIDHVRTFLEDIFGTP